MNTLTYLTYRNQGKSMEKFRDRSKFLRSSGICYNLIFLGFEKDRKSRVVGCPLHPEQNNGKDLRIGYCEINHLCKAAQLYNRWGKKRKQEFIRFLKAKKLDWYEYSVRMDNNELIDEFLEKS